MSRLQPHSHPDGFWPSCDDEPPGVSIQPFSHADLAALLAHLDHDQDSGDTLSWVGPAPVVAVRVRACVGRRGASAHAEYRPGGPPSVGVPTGAPHTRLALLASFRSLSTSVRQISLEIAEAAPVGRWAC